MGEESRSNSDKYEIGSSRKRSISRDRTTDQKRSRHADAYARRSEKTSRDSDSEVREDRSRHRSRLSRVETNYRDESEARYRKYRRRRTHDSRSRSGSPQEHRHRHRHGHGHSTRSQSPPTKRDLNDKSRSPPARLRKSLPSQDESYRGQDNEDGTSTALEKIAAKQKPNFKTTGLLAAETNKISVSGGSGNQPKSIVLKYHEPAEARKPPSSQPWSVYVFKGDSPDPIQTISLHTRSCWLLGRETAVVDIPTEHPSCSKQHAVFQFRYVTKKDEFGDKTGKVGLYIIDLESANGTFLNGEKIEAARYVECLNNDILKFGESAREFVILLPSK